MTPDATYPINVINDISAAGIRFYLDAVLAPRLRVAVEYVEPGIKLEVNGIIAWCAARLHGGGGGSEGDGLGRFIVGVQLLSPMLLKAVSKT